jgi:MFS transporter, OFA family, oxalate/formate antiporter
VQTAPQPIVASWLKRRLPFFYGWVVLACLCCCGFARQGPAVATLSIFVEPMTSEFGWSRTALAGAVSLGGILAALTSPLIGPLLDRRGARLLLCAAVLLTGLSTMLLSAIQSILGFYLLFCIARMNFAGPFDLGIYGAVNNWFLARRAIVNAIIGFAQMLGLVLMPLIAHLAMREQGWRGGWLAVGSTVLIIGLLPAWLVLVRRPEDLGLLPDGGPLASAPQSKAKGPPVAVAEPHFSRAQALRTPTFWLLSLYTVAVYPVQAGISLHQAPHMLESGLSATVAATVVSTFSFTAAVAGLGFAALARRLGVRALLAISAAALGASALLMGLIAAPWQAYLAAGCFGAGIGGILTLLPLAWADYFGRASFGAIRGVALSLQVTAQAAGPLLSGLLRDASGSYVLSLTAFAALSFLAALIALLVRPPAGASVRPAPPR